MLPSKNSWKFTRIYRMVSWTKSSPENQNQVSSLEYIEWFLEQSPVLKIKIKWVYNEFRLYSLKLFLKSPEILCMGSQCSIYIFFEVVCALVYMKNLNNIHTEIPFIIQEKGLESNWRELTVIGMVSWLVSYVTDSGEARIW